MPAFARLGPYPTAELDRLAYSRRDLFEGWGHAACLLPASLYPTLRYRMERHAGPVRELMRSKQGAYMARVYAEVAERGPVAASGLAEPGRGSGGWWGWAPGKAALERLFSAGLLAVAGRRGFERLYDLAERVIPRAALEARAPAPEEAMKQLICLGARASGVGTAIDIAGYMMVDGWRDRPPGPDGRRPKPVARRLVSELVEDGRLLPATVEGWDEPAYVHPEARVPAGVQARALLTPFDSLVWALPEAGQGEGSHRRRVQRLFGMSYTLEIYLPASRRVHGYYVLPFLLGDALVARCDLKADRRRGVLQVQGAFLEPGQDGRRVVPELAQELRDLGQWLGLEGVEVAGRGDLAAALSRSLGLAQPVPSRPR